MYAEKVVIVGSAEAGKTCLMNSIYDSDGYRHRDAYTPTIGVDFCVRNISTRPPIKLQLWDTAGQERFRTITRSYYRGAQQILLTFDASDIESFKELKETWLPEVLNHTNPENRPHLILVGTKTDLKTTENTVLQTDIYAFAAEHNMPYFRVSSKNQENIGLVVEQLEHNAKEYYRVTQYSKQFQSGADRQMLRPVRQSRPSFSNKALLAMTATGAGAIAIGYALFQYKAEIALLVGTHMPPALLVGLAIIAAVAAAYGAYYCFFGNKPPGQEGLVRHKKRRISSRTTDDYGAAWGHSSEDGDFPSGGASSRLHGAAFLEHSSSDEFEETLDDSHYSLNALR